MGFLSYGYFLKNKKFDFASLHTLCLRLFEVQCILGKYDFDFQMKCFSPFSQVNFIALVCGYQIENKDERYCDVIGKFALLNCRFCSCINSELCLWPPNRYILVLGLITPCICYKWNSYSSFLKEFQAQTAFICSSKVS